MTSSDRGGDCRLAALMSHPVQYKTPIFRKLSSLLRGDLVVYYWRSECFGARHDAGFRREVSWDIPLLEGYKHRVLDREGGDLRALLRLIRRLRETSCGALWVSGYHNWWAMLAAAFAKAAGLSVIFRGQADFRQPSAAHRAVLKRVALPVLFQLFDAVLYSYGANRNYFEAHGVDEGSLFFCPSAVDGSWLTGQLDSPGREARELRGELGIPERAVVGLYVGKLTERKGVEDLLHAFGAIEDGSRPWLVLVGSGPEEDRLRRIGRCLDLKRARMVGFRNQSEVPRYYAMADFLVLPSFADPSPKVINEALVFGLPVIASAAVGTVGDLVVDGWNGYVHEPGDRDQIARCLREMVGSEERRAAFGKRSESLVDGWSIDRAAEGVHRALKHVSRTGTAR